MSSYRNIVSAVAGLGIACSLFLGVTGVAHASFNISSYGIASAGDASAISTSMLSADEKLASTSSDLSSAPLEDAASRGVPDKTVAQADAYARSLAALTAKLEQGQAVSASDYLADIDQKVSWNSVVASTYGVGDGLLGSSCSDGSVVTETSMGVANKTLPLGTKLQIIYGGRVVEATVVDRGPYIDGRDLDLQPAVAKALGFNGLGTVRYRTL